MSHHTDQDREDDDSGAGVEAWLLRLVLIATVALAAAAIVTSLSDIQRYLRMRQM
jgi:hypothetical protein